MKFFIRVILALAGLVLTAIVLAGAVTAAGWYYLSPGLPSVEAILDVRLQEPLRIYSRDGRLIAQLGEYRRNPVSYEELPAVLIEAVLAAEDDRFFSHPGFDYQGMTRAGINFLMTGSRSQGGSTITQQLARNYFLTPERTFVRKAKELLLALQIERALSKEQILTLYLNKIFLGQRAYGVAAAAEVYFGKGLPDLTIPEAALLAGIPKAPSQLNPVSDPVRAAERRSYVLRRMRDLDFIDSRQYEEALATPIDSRLRGARIELDAPYIAEMARAEMVARFGAAATTDGYRVITTVDSRLQAAADRALRTGLLDYDRRHGFRGAQDRDTLGRLATDRDRDEALQRLLDSYPTHPDLYPAVVTGLRDDDGADVFIDGVGPVGLPFANLRWRAWVDDDTVGPQPRSAADMVATGDVVYLLRTANRGWLLAQLPEVQGALVAIDPLDGATVALAGGYDFFASKFNRAVQARRQPGSSFKPFVYSAALEHGFTTATVINDAPIVFDTGSASQGVWRPENSTGRFYGPTRFREALVQSLNLVSIRILLQIGVNQAVDHVRAFGLPDSAIPRNPTLVLGSGGATPREITGAFAAFANGGYRVEPYLLERIEDARGAVVFEARTSLACPDCLAAPTRPVRGLPRYEDAGAMLADGEAWRTEGDVPATRILSPENAYLMYDIMRDVIRRGTGRRALALGRGDLAGKTGTSNDRRDAWFSGYNRDLVATVWIGFDQERSLGSREEGSRTALPVWTDFMGEALKGRPEAPLPRPPGVVTARISASSGLLALAGTPDGIFELFRESDLVRLGTDSNPDLPGGALSPSMDPGEIF